MEKSKSTNVQTELQESRECPECHALDHWHKSWCNVPRQVVGQERSESPAPHEFKANIDADHTEFCEYLANNKFCAQPRSAPVHTEAPEPTKFRVSPAANIAWLKANRTKYEGQWVAIRNGEFLGSANSYEELQSQVGPTKGTGILLTPIYRSEPPYIGDAPPDGISDPPQQGGLEPWERPPAQGDVVDRETTALLKRAAKYSVSSATWDIGSSLTLIRDLEEALRRSAAAQVVDRAAVLEEAAHECEFLLESQLERTSDAGAGSRVAIRACIATIRALSTAPPAAKEDDDGN